MTPRHVGLQRQHLQIEHQLHVVFPDRRHAGRPLEIRQRGRVALLGLLNPPLHFAHRIEILVHAWCDRRRRAPSAAGPCRASSNRGCCRSSSARRAAARASAVAEQPLEDDARIGFGRQRRRRRRPGQVVLIGARVAVVAVADLRDQVGAEFERRNLRVAADALRRRSDRPSCRAGSRCLRSAWPCEQLRNAQFAEAWLPVV